MPGDGIEGKVASIVNATELVINRGRRDGVGEGMKFGILDPSTEDVVDPDSGELLGKLWRPKLIVEVISVDDRFSLAKTYFRRRENIGGTAAAVTSLARLFEAPRWVERRETFDSPESEWKPIDEAQSVVKVGDIARQIVRTLSDDPNESGVLLESENGPEESP